MKEEFVPQPYLDVGPRYNVRTGGRRPMSSWIVEFWNGRTHERVVVPARSHEEAYYAALRVAGAEGEPDAQIREQESDDDS